MQPIPSPNDAPDKIWWQSASWPRGYKTWVHAQTQNKAQWLAVCGHVSASSQSLRFILSLRMNSSFITSRPGLRDSHDWKCGRMEGRTDGRTDGRRLKYHTISCPGAFGLGELKSKWEWSGNTTVTHCIPTQGLDQFIFLKHTYGIWIF